MRVEYNRVSTFQQTGNRFTADSTKHDLVRSTKSLGQSNSGDEKRLDIDKIIDEGKVSELTVEDFSRFGRNSGDCIWVLGWFEENGVNIKVRNLGLQSRPNGIKNPI